MITETFLTDYESYIDQKIKKNPFGGKKGMSIALHLIQLRNTKWMVSILGIDFS